MEVKNIRNNDETVQSDEDTPDHLALRKMSNTSGCRAVYLTPDERYDIWTVKAAERPKMLRFVRADVDATPIALQDGCDIQGWRQHDLVSTAQHQDSDDTNDELKGVLNIGQGCALLRRESQIPLVSTRRLARWQELRKRLLGLETATNNTETKTNSSYRMPRVDYRDCQSLHPWFERENVPAVLDHAMVDWSAQKTCRLDTLVSEYGDRHWRFSDTHAETMRLSTYRRYVAIKSSVECMTDDAPLAVYDSQFGYDEDDDDDVMGASRRRLLLDYQVPKCFDTDLLEVCLQDEKVDDDSHRPPFRWILMGPERSGTGLHVDPVGTHAWVALVEGCKRWVLFPPHVDRSRIGMMDDDNDDAPQIPSSVWFATWHYRAVQAYPNDVVEYVQQPGEIVYVPAGWPHIVLNLDWSVAITHNYATQYPSLDRLQRALRKEEPELAQRFDQGLSKYRPSLSRQKTIQEDSSGNSCSPPYPQQRVKAFISQKCS